MLICLVCCCGATDRWGGAGAAGREGADGRDGPLRDRGMADTVDVVM